MTVDTLAEHNFFIKNEVLLSKWNQVDLTHCYIHDCWEPLFYPFYRLCYECGHVYQTPLSLVLAYERIHRQMWRENWGGQRKGRPLPAGMIFFCQFCIHDF